MPVFTKQERKSRTGFPMKISSGTASATMPTAMHSGMLKNIGDARCGLPVRMCGVRRCSTVKYSCRQYEITNLVYKLIAHAYGYSYTNKRMSSRQVIARGQTTIYIQKDSYTISQSLGEYVFPADHSGKVLSAVSLTSTIKVTCGDSEYKDFTIGVIVKPAGFSSISVDNSRKQ